MVYIVKVQKAGIILLNVGVKNKYGIRVLGGSSLTYLKWWQRNACITKAAEHVDDRDCSMHVPPAL